VVVLAEAVCFVADGLAESEAGVSAIEFNWLGFFLYVNEFFFFGE